ncbi:MAG: PUA domain-containing protein, partial [Cyanobacteriota bacterium SKYGB_h_bin112]|nr:PUA domain-containing protein [Cyanobacteriota bacterium SKYGB_h_bin112]
TAAGARTVITEGRSPQHIEAILQGATIGTHFEAQSRPTSARKRWIVHGLVPQGKLYLDAGAVHAVTKLGKSLLAAGITGVEGDFPKQSAVRLCSPTGDEIARGIVNYDSRELQQIRGLHSSAIPSVLGYDGVDTVVHRDNLVINRKATLEKP